jgi:hypothetical protein
LWNNVSKGLILLRVGVGSRFIREAVVRKASPQNLRGRDAPATSVSVSFQGSHFVDGYGDM